MSVEQVDVHIFDTTLRDGAQSLPKDHQFPVASKAEIAEKIASLGVDVIEAGFPATPGDAVEVKEVARTVGNKDYTVFRWQQAQFEGEVSRPPIIAGLSRTTKEDIETTWDAVQYASRPRIHTFISTDPEHMAAKFPGKSQTQVLNMGRNAIRMAREFADEHTGASVEFSAEAASTTDPGYLEKVIRTAVAEGADIINLPDTVGQRNPFWMKDFYSKAIEWIRSENPDIVISAHNHNDLGMAAANSYALLIAAADSARKTQSRSKIQLEGTICGLGERAGNADIFTMMGELYKFVGDLAIPVTWSFNPEKSVQVANDVLDYAGLSVDRQNPIVGRDTMVHRSGIHSDGVIKGGHQIYTPHDPTFWGHMENAVHEEGRYQGKAGRAAAHGSVSQIGASDLRRVLHGESNPCEHDYDGFEDELKAAGVTN